MFTRRNRRQRDGHELSMSQGERHELMTALKIVGRLRKHDRLSTQSGLRIDIDRPHLFQPLMRWCGSENRRHNIDRIAAVLERVFAVMRSGDPGAERFMAELPSTATGLRNLQDTYAECTVTQARLEILLEDIETEQEEFRADGDGDGDGDGY